MRDGQIISKTVDHIWHFRVKSVGDKNTYFVANTGKMSFGCIHVKLQRYIVPLTERMESKKPSTELKGFIKNRERENFTQGNSRMNLFENAGGGGGEGGRRTKRKSIKAVVWAHSPLSLWCLSSDTKAISKAFN